MTTTALGRPNRLVQRIHFEDFGGTEFERLVFAYHVRAGWQDVEWYGQGGGDHGRDMSAPSCLTTAPAGEASSSA